MSKLYVMCGIPGSGKSTHAQKIKELEEASGTKCYVLSSDGYRKKMLGDESDQTHNNEVFTKLYEDMRRYLAEGSSVVVDATNTTLKARRRILSEANRPPSKAIYDSIYKVCVIVNETAPQCVLQDAKRERSVGIEVIYKFVKTFQCPQIFEGFDAIECTRLPEFNVGTWNRFKDMMKNFDQRNPHHKYDLLTHCCKLAENYPVSSAEQVAAQLHDVGKLLTGTTDSEGINHYYHHDSVGAYQVMSHPELIDDELKYKFLYILFLINYHMRGHKDFLGCKAKSKYMNLFGLEWYDKLIQFAEYDKIASGTYYDHEKIIDELNRKI